MDIKKELKTKNIILKGGKINSATKKILKKDFALKEKIFKITPFIENLNDDSLTERIYCIMNDISKKPICKNCFKEIKFKRNYSLFCSIKCVAKSAYIKEKIKNTNLKKYGTACSLQNKDIKEKTKETNLKKYDHYHPCKSKKIKEKIKKTKLERYGNEYYTNIDKGKETCLKKYGVEFTLQSLYFREMAHVSCLKNNNGIYHFQKHMPLESLEKLNDKDWCHEQHIKNKRTLSEIATSLEVHGSTVGNYFKKHEIVVKYFFTSLGEKEIVDFLKEHYQDEIQTNNRKLIYPYELDIVIPNLKLAIEYCGLYWHSTANQFDKNYHLNKLKLCQQNGYRLITIFEDEWIYRQKQVKQKLLSLVGKDERERIFARKCEIRTIKTKNKVKFLNEFHIQGDGPGSINIGLFYKNNLVAVITFINQKKQYILNRYATSCHVVGGFSKLLNYFERNYEEKPIISFADRRWSDGNLYEQTGFKLERILKPDYKYLNDQKEERIHKFLFRHKFLKDKLKIYDPNLSELENTKMNNIYRIYDCGLLKYRKE